MVNRHLTWSNFEEGIIRPGEERLHAVSQLPYITVFSDRGGTRIGMIVEDAGTTITAELSRLLRFEVVRINVEGRSCLMVVCTGRPFFREAYLLFTTVIDRVMDDGYSATGALAEELAFLEALADRQVGLSVERQIGLFGELTVLAALVALHGPPAVSTWVGPLAEPHDFRMGMSEFEVKTTVGRKRQHHIHGFMQVTASFGRDLSFISITLGPAGGGDGASLPSLVETVRQALKADPAGSASFEESLKAGGYLDADALAYPRRWLLRQSPRLIPVNSDFPAVTRQLLEKSLGPLVSRLEQIGYEVNLEGMGDEWDLSQALPANPPRH